MSSWVKWPTEPSGSRKKRIATNPGFVPMSNQLARPGGDAEQVPRLAADDVDPPGEPQVERAAAVHEKTHLVVGVRVFRQELPARLRRFPGHVGSVGSPCRPTTSTVP